MSSLRRQLSSQANGRLSRGPATPEGKARSSQNAVSHGLLSDCVVLPGESLEGFETLFEKHLDRFGPLDVVERAMIEEMAASYWRLRRAWAIENDLLTSEIDLTSPSDDRSRITAAFRKLASSPDLALLHRYETRLHMMYQRALHNILLLRTIPLAGQDVGQVVTDLPTEQSPTPPAPSSPGIDPTSPPALPPEPTPVAPSTEPPTQWDRPSSSVVCQPAASQPEPTPPADPAQPSPVGQILDHVIDLPTDQSGTPRTPGIPNEPSPISEHSQDRPAARKARPICHPRGSISRPAANPEAPRWPFRTPRPSPRRRARQSNCVVTPDRLYSRQVNR
jgi:hypothetical protein